jgi:hypothetical protein
MVPRSPISPFFDESIDSFSPARTAPQLLLERSLAKMVVLWGRVRRRLEDAVGLALAASGAVHKTLSVAEFKVDPLSTTHSLSPRLHGSRRRCFPAVGQKRRRPSRLIHGSQ